MRGLAEPRTDSSRLPFGVGEAGHYIAAMASIPYAVMAFLFVPFPSILYMWWFLSVLLSVGLFLHAFAYYGFWRRYHSRIGMVAFACGLMAAVSMLATGVVASGSCGTLNAPCYRGIPPSTMLLFVASLVLLGVTAIAEGATFLIVRRFTRAPRETYAAGVLCIVAGAFLASIVLAFLGGFFVLAAALVLGGVALRKAPALPMAIPRSQIPSL